MRSYEPSISSVCPGPHCSPPIRHWATRYLPWLRVGRFADRRRGLFIQPALSLSTKSTSSRFISSIARSRGSEVSFAVAGKRGSGEAHGRVAAAISRLGETWAYRPSRARHVVAVSEGALSELLEEFPALVGMASTIPNGVDQWVGDLAGATSGDVDSDASRELEAVFVGSEWEGKGLRYAIGALALAPAVAPRRGRRRRPQALRAASQRAWSSRAGPVYGLARRPGRVLPTRRCLRLAFKLRDVLACHLRGGGQRDFRCW